MATITHGIGNADTVGGTGATTTGAFTPAVGDLLVVFIAATDGVMATPAVTGTGAGLTWTMVTSTTYRTSLDTMYLFVANAFVSAASSQTVSFTSSGDSITGSVIWVARVAGLQRTGLQAVRQTGKQANGAAAGTPAPVFGQAALTGNPCLGCVGNATNPAGMTPPASWSEPSADLGYATPTAGSEYAGIASGFTGTTVTWGSTSATTFGAIVVELDVNPYPNQTFRNPLPPLIAQ